MKTDIEILEESLSKYKNQNGKKAKNLQFRISGFKAKEELFKQLKY